eukprot:CAMPEP_0203947280 /NCGR_PEP_ID=MMETSP0359-20131031/82295_1 /ASSEMBLY_ACC=CAM_ASM_000338 /TAXON_ID=268821 /ORGANISM="Scrippsiella Hangoei, Strain SHTV-5" /LENGTH=613 /DNA_ID=CAMNT_0050878679 /DNA_START=167 /DNA_END=2004 /DNA_ORIENTATION=+
MAAGLLRHRLPESSASLLAPTSQLQAWAAGALPSAVGGGAADGGGSQCLKVTIVCARGLPLDLGARLAGNGGGASGVFCSCTVMGKASSKIVTSRACAQHPHWYHEASMAEFVVGDALLFGVWEDDWAPLGTALLESFHFHPCDFEGELELSEAGRALSAFLYVQVSVVPTAAMKIQAPGAPPVSVHLGPRTTAPCHGSFADGLPPFDRPAHPDAVEGSSLQSRLHDWGFRSVVADENEECRVEPDVVIDRPGSGQAFRPGKPGAFYQGPRLPPTSGPPPPLHQQQQSPARSDVPSYASSPNGKEPLGCTLDEAAAASSSSALGPIRSLMRTPGQGGDRLSSLGCGTSPRQGLPEDPEERDWIERQRRTGCVGRLVNYDRWDCPQADFLLRGGCGNKVMVAQVTEGGRAHRMGVKAGDMLVSIDGRKDFLSQPGELLHASVVAPVTLVFMGFVGRPTAEVQLASKAPQCGSPESTPFLSNLWSNITLLDQIVFQPGKASSVMLATNSPSCGGTAGSGDGLGPQSSPHAPGMDRGARSVSPAVFELAREDAVNVVRHALSPRCRADSRRDNFRGSPSAARPMGGASQLSMPSMAPLERGVRPSSPSTSARPPSS